MKTGGRMLWFVDLYYDEDCLTPRTLTLVMPSRLAAKKAVTYYRSHSLAFHGFDIRGALQRDLFFTGWKVRRLTGRRRYRPRWADSPTDSAESVL